MNSRFLTAIVWMVCAASAWAQQDNACQSLMNFKTPGVEITKAAPIAEGSYESKSLSAGRFAPIARILPG